MVSPATKKVAAKAAMLGALAERSALTKAAMQRGAGAGAMPPAGAGAPPMAPPPGAGAMPPPGAGGPPPGAGAPPGMKKGGKVKRYDDGGDVEDDGAFAQPKGQSDDMSPADVKEMKDRQKATNAYNKAVKTPSNPKKNYASGGMTKSSASKRADGIATKGFTKGKYC